MEENFKIGDEVYDSMYYPNIKGIIISIDDINGCYPITVNFNDERETYTQYGGINTKYNTKSLSLTPYEVELKGFTQVRPKEQPICYVGKKIEHNGSLCLILNQYKDIVDTHNRTILIEDITNGKYKIID